MPNIPGLQRRRLTYYIRVRIPQDLVDTYKKEEIVRSLETRDYNAACQRIHGERTKIASEFAEKRHQLKSAANDTDMLSGFSDHELEGLVLRWLTDIEKRAKTKAASGKGERAEPDSEEDIALTLKQDVAVAHHEVKGTGKKHKDSDKGEVHHGMDSAAKFLRQRGITFNPQSQKFQELGNLFSNATYAMAQHNLQQWQGLAYAPANPLFKKYIEGGVQGDGLAGKLKKKVTVKQLFAEYMNDPAMERSLTTIKNYQTILRALEEMLGSERHVHEITQEDAEELRNLLLRSPSNATKMAPGKTLKEAADLAAIHNWPLLDRSTVRTHLAKLKAVMQFALRKKYILENPANDIQVQDKEKKKDKRMPFNTEQLNAIFKAPLYTGCVNDERGYSKKGDLRPRGARFWIPIIGLFTGMRLNEICQLEIADIAKQDGVDVILIREESDDTDAETQKQVKTASGIRYVPIHSELKKIGLMEYVAEVKKAGHKRLFPTLEISALGYFSADFSKWFGRFLKSVGVKNKKTTFHSLRHNFRDAMYKADISQDLARLLGGWSSSSIDSNYGGGTSSVGVTAEDLFLQMEKVQYKGVDLSHIYKENAP